jgi:tRNA-specific 2-thiouridylase
LGGSKEKYFVCSKDIKKNILYVCDQKHKDKFLNSTNAEIINFNWINSVPKNHNVNIRFRHRQKLIKGKFIIKNNKVLITYKKTLSVTPGQFAVFYQNSKCLGGGIINKQW